MPRYFFNTRIGDELISDPDGEVLVDPDRAWEMARAMIRELLKTEGADGALLNATIEVTDDEGEIVLEFPFAEAILDAPGGPITQALTAHAVGVSRRSAQRGFRSAVSDCASGEKCRRLRFGKPPAPASCWGARRDRLPRGRKPMISRSSAPRSLLLAGAFFSAFTLTAAAQQPAAPRRPPAQRLRPRQRFRRARH